MRKRKKRYWSEADYQLNEQSTTLTAHLHGLACPECNSKKYAKNGKDKGNQRYRCCKCGKHFRSTTGNTIHHLHLKPKIQGYIHCMNQGLSLRKTADKLEISLQTAFRWRHRFLSAMKKQPEEKQRGSKTLSAFILPFSAKGKPEPEASMPDITSLVRVDMTGKTVVNVLGTFGQSAVTLAEKLTAPIMHISSRSIPRICKQETSKCTSHQQISLTEEIHTHLCQWLGAFRGVATKYLENYWCWYSLIRQLQQNCSDREQYMYRCF